MSKRKIKRFFASIVCVFIPVRRIRHQVTDAIMKDHGDKRAYIKIKQEWLARYNGQKLIPGRFEKYDLIFGIGATCGVRQYLESNKLVRFTTPLDWTGTEPPENWTEKAGIWRDTKFKAKINYLCNNFVGWAAPGDFCEYCYGNSSELKHHVVLNKKTKIRFMHAFPLETSLELYLPTFIETMNRRAKRLMNAIDNSSKILIVWLHRVFHQVDLLDAPVSDADIKYAVKKLSERFPGKEIDVVLFEHDGYKNKFEFDKKRVGVSKKCSAYRIKSNHCFVESCYKYKYNYPFAAAVVVAEMLDNIALSDRQVVD